jgi:hydrogenase maturation protease
MRILVAGIGNIFFGDDGFGCEVVRELSKTPLPPHVTVRDFGIRGLDLAYTLLEGWDFVIIVDAVSRGRDPGTLYVIEPDLSEEQSTPSWEGHSMTLEAVAPMLRSLGGTFPRSRVVGCEPENFEADLEASLPLSLHVKAAVPEALKLIREMLTELSENVPIARMRA